MLIPADGDLSPLHYTSLPSASVGCIAFTFSYHATCILYMQNATHILLQHMQPVLICFELIVVIKQEPQIVLHTYIYIWHFIPELVSAHKVQ